MSQESPIPQPQSVEAQRFQEFAKRLFAVPKHELDQRRAEVERERDKTAQPQSDPATVDASTSEPHE